MRFGLTVICFTIMLQAVAQQTPADSAREEKKLIDSTYIVETEQKTSVHKVLHAEPLYIDLIRDLGARKGEKEWNVGFGLKDKVSHDAYEGLVEYEWAPVNRLGFEIEVPFTLYMPLAAGIPTTSPAPKSAIQGLKLATQWTYFVSDRLNTSLALGYIHEFLLPAFSDYGRTPWLSGQALNPFAVVAKRWGRNFHTLIYTGPEWEYQNSLRKWHTGWQHHTNFHYMISGTRNFVGLEVNQHFDKQTITTVLRPQMRLGISEKMLIGVVTGIPLNRQNERFSMFLRLIYEPGH